LDKNRRQPAELDTPGLGWNVLVRRQCGRDRINVARSIALDHSTGMNIVYARQRCAFGDTLPKNTQI